MANQALFDSYFFSTVPAATNQYTDSSLPYGGGNFNANVCSQRSRKPGERAHEV